jgi:hypothetical protein
MYEEFDDNPFGTPHRKRVLEDLLSRRLIKRITLIEGNYPTTKEQNDFVKRVMRWLSYK